MNFPKPTKQVKTKKRRVKTEYQKKRDEADRLFSLLIRKVEVCQLAGLDKVRCGGGLQCAHIVGRAIMRLRWDTANALSLCAGHHVFYTNNPEQWRELMEDLFPEEWAYVNSVRNEKWDRDIDKILKGFEGVI